VTSFIVSFGIVKAVTNLVSGQLADGWGRKKTLVLGWAVGLPVPFLIMWAPAWGWIVAANMLLGINQGLCWSMTVIMKIDLVGPRQRGLAVGLNEFAGYLAVGLTAFLTGYLATLYGLRPVPFYLGVGYAVAGLLLSAWVAQDTRRHGADWDPPCGNFPPSANRIGQNSAGSQSGADSHPVLRPSKNGSGEPRLHAAN
jgi:MFS family permease